MIPHPTRVQRVTILAITALGLLAIMALGLPVITTPSEPTIAACAWASPRPSRPAITARSGRPPSLGLHTQLATRRATPPPPPRPARSPRPRPLPGRHFIRRRSPLHDHRSLPVSLPVPSAVSLPVPSAVSLPVPSAVSLPVP